ncbi:MAG: hypothetical protein LBC27_09160 [Spirochaetaceae bacterium]|nr:hypothetical protein [Spirochaetaceae bacterium]
MSISRKMMSYQLKKMATEKKRVSAKQWMKHTAINENFLYQALLTE